jgi:predicted ATPase
MESDESSLVGRVAELAAVERVLVAARRAPAAVLEVVGEPGIGKTRLLLELVVRAERAGLCVHSGRGDELERSLPFGLVVDALDEPLAALDPGQLNRLGAEARARLGGVFPALASVGSEPSGLSAERYRVHYAIRALLELLAGRRPLVVALDDVHWADDASLELLAHLARRPPRAALALVIAYRPAQAPSALTAALLDAERAGVLERIALGPITAVEADELLGGRFDAARRRALYCDSGGNPFYLKQLARAADHARAGAPAAATDPGVDSRLPDVPRVVLSALGEELAALSERVRMTARAAAVAGEAFGPRLVADIAGASYQDVLADVDTLIDCDLIRPAPPAQFRFRHPIVRRAVYDSGPAAWLVGAHARAALALEAAGSSAVARAHRVERSATPGDEHAIATVTAAANASLTLAPGTAARFYEAALRLLPDGEEAIDRRLGLLAPLATALGTCGELETSRATMLQILGLLPADQPAHAELVAVLAAIDHLLGHYDEADALLHATLDRLREASSPESTALLLALAAGSYYQGEWASMAERAQRARRHATTGGDDGHHAEAASMLALSACAQGDVRAAYRELAAAAPLIDGLPTIGSRDIWMPASG